MHEKVKSCIENQESPVAAEGYHRLKGLSPP